MLVAGWTIRGANVWTLTIGAVTITGTGETCEVFSLAFGVEQIEQVWRADFSLSGCEWTAWAVPTTSIITMQSTDTTALQRS